MEVKDLLFMNKGDGENSYMLNCRVAQKVVFMTKPAIEEAVWSMFSEDSGFQGKPVLNVADLGCATGPTTFFVMSTVLSTVEKTSREIEIKFYLNDLIGNDFNTLFKGLSRFRDRNKDVSVPYFVMGAPGSFYGRLFPRNSMDLIYSSYCLHWLSKVPKLTSEGGVSLNKSNIYNSKTSPEVVKDAYLVQFQDDFSSFLKARSQEMVCNGRMILIVQHGTTLDPMSNKDSYIWGLLTNAISQMVSEGMIDKEKLDSFNVPYYCPSSKELQDLVDREGSFRTERLETLTTDNKEVWLPESEGWDVDKMAETVALHYRSFTESIMAYQFGQNLMEQLYGKFIKNILVDDLSKNSIKTMSLMIVLKKIV